mgnify:CR=1 FL=1
MTPKPSVGDAEGWTRRFLKYQALQVAAQRRGDIPAANRHVEKVTEALDVLAKTGLEGRMASEERLLNSFAVLQSLKQRRFHTCSVAM